MANVSVPTVQLSFLQMISIAIQNSLRTVVVHFGSQFFHLTEVQKYFAKCSEAQTNSLASDYPVLKIPILFAQKEH